MNFKNHFTVAAPLDQVNAFHRSARSLKTITPPFLFMSNVSAPERLTDGDEMAFTLWFGPMPVRWRVRVENFHPTGFDDVQLSGPFRSWKHSHRFEPIDGEHTRVVDQISYSIRPHWFWGVVGLAMALGLPLLFWYRSWRTRATLERLSSS